MFWQQIVSLETTGNDVLIGGIKLTILNQTLPLKPETKNYKLISKE